MRVIFMGTPEFALPSLEYLISSEHQITAVYTQTDKAAGRGRTPVPSPVKKLALEHGLDIFQPLSLKQPEEAETFLRLKPDIVVTAAYGKILPPAILDIPAYGCLNIHPSLLPRHRGPSPVTNTILEGDETTGVSIMLMDEGMDTGPVIARLEVPLSPDDTTGSLTAKLSQIGAGLLEKTLPAWLGGELFLETQNEDKATYSRIISKEQGEIDWQRHGEELWRRIKAFQPWPGCYTTWQGKLLKIIKAVPIPGTGEPGRVISLKDREGISLGIQTGGCTLGIQQLQLAGKRIMSADDFLRGQKDFIGSLLPS